MKYFYLLLLLVTIAANRLCAQEERWTEPNLSADTLLFIGLVSLDASYSQNKIWFDNGVNTNAFVSPGYNQAELMYFANYTPRILTYGFSIGIDYLEYLDDVRGQYTRQLQIQRIRFAGPASEVSIGWENPSLGIYTFARYGSYGRSIGIRYSWTLVLSKRWVMDTNLEFSSAPGTFGDQINGYTAFLYPLDAVSNG